MKKFLAALLATALLLSLAACTQAPAPSGTTTTGDPKTTGAPKATTLKLGLPDGYKLTDKKIVENFQAKYPMYKLEVDETPWGDFKTKLQTQIAANNAPDVFFTDSGYAATIDGNGAAYDLTDLITRDIKADDFTPMLTAIKNAKGRVYGIPHAVNVAGLLYNKTLFDAAGVAYPSDKWTFQDMLDAAVKLTTKDTYGLLFATDSPGIGWLLFTEATGGAPLNAARDKANFTDPKTVEGFQKFYDCVNTLKCTPPKAWIDSFGGTPQAFAQGKAAMTIAQASHTKIINNANADLNYDAMLIPNGFTTGKRTTCVVPNPWIIFSRASDDAKAAAWNWLQFYFNDESQAIYAAECPGGYPIRKSALDIVSKTTFKPLNKAAFIDGLSSAVTLYENATWQNWMTEDRKIILDLYQNNISVKDATEKMQKLTQDVLDGK